MTNEQLEEVYKANMPIGHMTALRAVYNQGWYEGAGQTPTNIDKSRDVAKPSVIIRYTGRVDK